MPRFLSEDVDEQSLTTVDIIVPACSSLVTDDPSEVVLEGEHLCWHLPCSPSVRRLEDVHVGADILLAVGQHLLVELFPAAVIVGLLVSP